MTATAHQPPLVIATQGSFAVGGTVITSPGVYEPSEPGSAGQTLHGDHAYVFYQVPPDVRPLPLAFLHGNSQFTKTWETTPDGRDGFQNIFLRRGYGVYLIDQPRRGNAGQSTLPMAVTPTPSDQTWFNTFRVGIWPDFFQGVQFAHDAATLDQYFRQMTPNTGPFNLGVAARAVAALFDRIGLGILVNHSQGGGVGWAAAIASTNIKAIVSYEPGSNFPFPPGAAPAEMPCAGGPLAALEVPETDFLKLTRLPILIVYGDYIPATPCANAGQDLWRVRLDMARRWEREVNRRGGDVTVVHLPEIGIHGNTHFPFSDLNNLAVADHMAAFLAAKRLA